MASETSSRDELKRGQGLPDTTVIERLVRRVRILLRSTWVATGLTVTVGLALAALVVVSLTDLVFSLGTFFRLLGLLVIAIPTLWVLTIGVLRPLLRRLTSALVARRIEKELPGIHNRLVSAIDLSEGKDHVRHSKAFHRRLIDEVLDRIRGFRLRKVLSLARLRRAGLFAASSVAILLLVFFVFSDRLPTAMARIFRPFADIPPASNVKYDVLVGEQVQPGDFETLRGEDVAFTVVLQKGEEALRAGDDPLTLIIRTEGKDGPSKRLRFDFSQVREGRAGFTLTGMQQSFSYRVYGGGTWSKKYQVAMLDRPRLVGVEAKLHYPNYMGLSEPRRNAPQTLDVTGPHDSRVELLIDVEGHAAEGEIHLLQEKVQVVNVAERPERVWFRDSLPEGSKAIGKWSWSDKIVGGEEKGGKVHSGKPAKGVSTHGFQNASIGFHVRRDENLFVYVYLVEKKLPESIMVRWHDGRGWEHRAFWGADKIKEGKLSTPSRRRIADLPAGGRLVRLEVPAKAVGLGGDHLHGLSLSHVGGRCYWAAAGAVPAAQKEVKRLVVTESLPLERVDRVKKEHLAATPESKWRGSFPLIRSGYYRVELRNRLGHANQQMKEGRLVAVQDAPPQIHIEQPGSDLVVSKAVRVPLFIWASDDYGLGELALSVQTKNSAFEGRPIKKYDQVVKSDATVTQIDLADLGLKAGETLKYRAVIRDRRGQSATTRDFIIRIADQKNAADQKFEQFDEKTDQFIQKLNDLTKEQGKIQEKAQELAEKYRPLTEKIATAKDAAAAEADNKDASDTAKADPKAADEPPLKLDPEAMKQLEKVRAELAKIAAQEEKNLQRSKELAAELKQLSKQTAEQPLLPQQIAQQLKNVEQAFDDTATKPLQDAAEAAKQGADKAKSDPDLSRVEQASKQAGENLKDLQDRLGAISKAQKQSQENAKQALDELRSDLVQQDAKMAARELKNLRDYVKSTRRDVNKVQSEQKELIKDADLKLSQRLFKNLKGEQKKVDQTADSQLASVAQLLDQLDKMQKRSEIPALRPPASGDAKKGDAKKGDAKKGDANKGDAKKGDANKGDAKKGDAKKGDAKKGDAKKGDAKKGDAKKGDAKKGDAKKGDAKKGDAKQGDSPGKQAGEPGSPEEGGRKSGDDERQPLFAPALGGTPPKPDPALTKRRRQLAAEKKAARDSGKKDGAAEERRQLRTEQVDQALDLDSADQALASDEKTLDQLLQQLAKGQQGKLNQEQSQGLAELLQSPALEQALDMRQRMQQMQNPDRLAQQNRPGKPDSGQPQPPSQPVPGRLPPASKATGPLTEIVGGDPKILVELDKLDVDTRAIIMKMQPRAREEILQGLREEGPEGYRSFIRDYFRRLTKARANPSTK